MFNDMFKYFSSLFNISLLFNSFKYFFSIHFFSFQISLPNCLIFSWYYFKRMVLFHLNEIQKKLFLNLYSKLVFKPIFTILIKTNQERTGNNIVIFRKFLAIPRFFSNLFFPYLTRETITPPYCGVY